MSEYQPSSSYRASKSRFFPYIHCKFCRVCPTTKMSSATVKSSMEGRRTSGAGIDKTCRWRRHPWRRQATVAFFATSSPGSSLLSPGREQQQREDPTWFSGCRRLQAIYEVALFVTFVQRNGKNDTIGTSYIELIMYWHLYYNAKRWNVLVNQPRGFCQFYLFTYAFIYLLI